VRSSWSRQPVTTATLFETASNSKMLTAYAAMKLVGTGAMELDSPLAGYLEEPFLPAAIVERGSAITLRHTLTHRSGLANEPSAEPELRFQPGERFSYSGQGFVYAAAAIEDLVGEPFEDHLTATLLGPLGMTSSGYGDEPHIVDRMASPHVSVTLPWVASLLVALVVWLALALASIAAARIRRGARRTGGPRRRLALAAVVGSAVFLPLFSTGNALRMAAVSALGFAAVALSERLLRPRRELPPGTRRLRKLTAVVILLVLGWAVVLRPPVPLTLRAPGSAAASGLRSTAGDLALFLGELMDPKRLDPDLAREMVASQVEVSQRVAWGLGVGLQSGDEVDAVWHWGVNFPGYQSLAVGFPQQRIGVVVLTNGGPASFTPNGMRYAGLELAREVAFRAVGGEHYGYWNDVQ
jgi:CubicO group peptidase (beta-lactamase class C family)